MHWIRVRVRVRLFNKRVSQFELNYWNKWTFPRHYNLLRCTCIFYKNCSGTLTEPLQKLIDNRLCDQAKSAWKAKAKKKILDTNTVLGSLFLSMCVLIWVSKGSWSCHLRDLSVWLKQTTARGLRALETNWLNPLLANTHTSTRLYAPCHVVINLNQSAWGCFEKGAVLSTQPICGNVSLTWSDSWTSKQLIHPTLRCLLWGRTLCKHLPRLGNLIYFLNKLTRSKINPVAAKVHFNKDSINHWTKPIEGRGCRSSLFVL